MIGKRKLCSRIFIKDIEHVREIESYFKVTNKSIEGTLVFTLMSETNAKSIVLNLYYLVDAFGLAENFSKQFVEIANNSFGIYILFLQIYCRVFFNALSDVTVMLPKTICSSLKLKRTLEKLSIKFLEYFYHAIVKQMQSFCLFWTLYLTLLHLSICFIPVGLVLIIARIVLKYWI